MKNTRLIFSFVVLAAATALFMGILGCEKDGDTGSDLDAYFAANPYLSDPRTESAETSGGLTIDPATATATAIGQQINFTVSGGDSQYSWGVSTPSAGSVARQSNTRFAVYTVSAMANNSVIVSDADGRTAIASISGSASALSITPAGSTYTSGFTNGQTTVALSFAAIQGTTIQFTGSGGNPPYTWASSIGAIGTVDANGKFTFVNPIAVVGDTTISLKDNSGSITSVKVTIQYKP